MKTKQQIYEEKEKEAVKAYQEAMAPAETAKASARKAYEEAMEKARKERDG